MRPFLYKRVFVVSLVVVILGGGLFFLLKNSGGTDEPTITELENVSNKKYEVIGTSIEGRDIEAYTYFTSQPSTSHLLFVGGIHGGYEWNSILLAYALIDHLDARPNSIPNNVRVTIIPSANPDGAYKVIGKEGRFSISDVPANITPIGLGRLNANNVDLNRNFDCKWKSEAIWRNNRVSAGSSPFSEPEAKAIGDFVLSNPISAAVFFHSQANAVYASECTNGILPETMHIMNAYSKASGYKAIDIFDSYEVTGDVEGWLASINIPAITVELKTHETIEWKQNLAGVKALFEYYK